MAKAKNGSMEAGKHGSEGQKLGCRLGSDAALLLGSLEFLLHGSTGEVTTRAYIALVDSLPKRQIEAVESMMRARGGSLSRLRRSCGPVSAEMEQEPTEGQGSSIINRIASIGVKSAGPIDAALESM